MSVAQYPLIPKQAFLYFPQDQDIFQLRNKQPHRIIFEGGVPYTSTEKQKLSQLQHVIKLDTNLHHIAFMQEPILLRFLQATKYDIENCIEELTKYKKWEDSVYPLTITPEIQHFLRQGFFYMTGRDCKFRPIIVVNVPRIQQADLKEKTFIDVIGYFFQYVVQNCFVQGQIETWITIVDLGKLGIFSMGSTVLDTIKFLSRHFRCRLHHNYLVNCPSSIAFIFGMIKKALTEDQVAKISLTEEPSLPLEAFRGINQCQVQQKYGGTQKNLTTFWPIKNNYSLENINDNQLISVMEYGQMHQNGLLACKKISKSLLKEAQQMIKHERSLDMKSKKVSIVRALQKEEQYPEPSWEDPPEIGDIPQPFSMAAIFANPHSEVSVSTKHKA